MPSSPPSSTREVPGAGISERSATDSANEWVDDDDDDMEAETTDHGMEDNEDDDAVEFLGIFYLLVLSSQKSNANGDCNYRRRGNGTRHQDY